MQYRFFLAGIMIAVGFHAENWMESNLFNEYDFSPIVNSIDPIRSTLHPATLDNAEQFEAFIRDNYDHNHHQQGSLRMAPLRKGCVVDRTGSVHGVKDLIVADASIIPFTVDGNTSAAAYLIGYTIARQLTRKGLGRKARLAQEMEWGEE
ncbi:GMC family oxidoreductase [Paenibacillus thiaminolyticus]|uniref:GMC family oxidoreductase n=1 Tax=Paenibacillus thiaminolyticus TaxID=49283 RepID=UPI003D2991C4